MAAVFPTDTSQPWIVNGVTYEYDAATGRWTIAGTSVSPTSMLDTLQQLSTNLQVLDLQLSQEISNRAAALASLGTDNTSQDTLINDLHTLTTTINSRIDSTETVNTDQSVSISNLTSDLNTLNTTVNSLNTLTASVNTLTSDIASLNTELDSKFNQYYSDNPPLAVNPDGTDAVKDGDVWFDSHNLRFNIRHDGYWVFTDRVEDIGLKNALYSAVNTSTDYASLRTALLAALV